MNIEINNGETCVVAVCLFGWGKGKTLHEALRNMRKASRGWVNEDYTVTLYPDGKERTYDFADNLERCHIRIWLTNDDTVTTDNFSFVPSPGKWAIYLGDEYNAIVAYKGKEDGDGTRG